MSKLSKALALLTLVLYGLAAMHCTLEGVPGFDFLKSCCFADSMPPTPEHCGDDGCSPVEDGSYRAEEQTVCAPRPAQVLAMTSPVLESLLPEVQAASLVFSQTPPELPALWRFSQRAALPPRAPSLVA